jgi:hypothetical protein
MAWRHLFAVSPTFGEPRRFTFADPAVASPRIALSVPVRRTALDAVEPGVTTLAQRHLETCCMSPHGLNSFNCMLFLCRFAIEIQLTSRAGVLLKKLCNFAAAREPDIALRLHGTDKPLEKLNA